MRETVATALAMDLVATRPDVADARARHIAFTPPGLIVLDSLRRAVGEESSSKTKIENVRRGILQRLQSFDPIRIEIG